MLNTKHNTLIISAIYTKSYKNKAKKTTSSLKHGKIITLKKMVIYFVIKKKYIILKMISSQNF